MHPDTVPCLLELTEEFDRIGIDRDTASDGSIGDTAHQARSSNHNRDDTPGSSTPQTDSDGEPDIRAVDIDKSGPWKNGFTMQKGVDFILDRLRSGKENRLKEIIYNGKCWYKSNGWNQQTYTGSNKHDQHAHFGAIADTGKLENDRRPWGLVEQWGDDNMGLPRKGDGPSEDVKEWQYHLDSLGYPFGPGETYGDYDGIYGDKMEKAVNKFRADVAGASPATMITGWTAHTIHKEMAKKYAGTDGKNGTNGKDGVNGKDGKDGQPGPPGELSGTFLITGGTVEAVAAPPVGR